MAIVGLVYGDPKLIVNETTIKLGEQSGTWLASIGTCGFLL